MLKPRKWFAITGFKFDFTSFCILIQTYVVKDLNALPADKHTTAADKHSAASFKNTQSIETGLSDHHIWSIPCSKLLSRNRNRNNVFTEILKTSILKVSKMIYWKIWLPVTDHLMNLIENLLGY